MNEQKLGMEKVYVTKDTGLPNYIPVPDALIGKGVSSTALILYGDLLRRTSWERKNGKPDRNGRYFVIQTIGQLCNVYGLSDTQVRRLIAELVKYGLVDKVRTQKGRPNRLYVLVPKVIYGEKKDEDKKFPNKGISLHNRDIKTSDYAYTGEDSL